MVFGGEGAFIGGVLYLGRTGREHKEYSKNN
jgi:hypothetical protein